MRFRFELALGLSALALTACDLGLDPSMIGGGGAGSSTSSSSSAGGGTSVSSSSSSTSSSSTSSSSGGGMGGAGGGGAGGAGGGGGAEPLPPCATPDDFETFEPNSGVDAWSIEGDISTQTQLGDRMVRADAQNASDARVVQNAPSDLDACFSSIRVDPNNGPDTTYLFASCGNAEVRFVVSLETGTASVVFIDPPQAPPSVPSVSTMPALPAGSNLQHLLRVRFGPTIVFEAGPQGAPTLQTMASFPRPAWLDNCELGFGLSSDASNLCRFDDFCGDAP